VSQLQPLTRAFGNQRRAMVLAAALVVAGFWISVPMGEWQIGAFVAVGVVLGLVNHVLTELTLLRSVEGGDLVTRKQFAVTSLVRLMAVSVVALTLAVVFWPDGATVLLGLAIFHLITLVFTGLPLLREIRKI
jgi:hypothetical protein